MESRERDDEKAEQTTESVSVPEDRGLVGDYDDALGDMAKDRAEITSSADAYGPARINDTAEYDRLMSELQEGGVQIHFSETMGLDEGTYEPSPNPGSPGNLEVNPDTDISTLEHEYDHYQFDRERGFPGIQHYSNNPELYIQAETRAYDLEISRAQENGLNDLSTALEDQKQATIKRLRGYSLWP